MNFQQATEALYLAFDTAWTHTPVQHENEIFDRPSDGSSWVRMVVEEAGDKQYTHGPPNARKWRVDGVVSVQIFSPAEGVGTGGVKRVLELAELARAVFRGKTISSCYFASATVGPALPDPAAPGRWVTRTLRAPFFFLETA